MGNPARRLIAIVAVLLVIVLSAVTLVPAAASYRQYLSAGALALALLVLVAILASWRPIIVAKVTSDEGATGLAVEAPGQAEAEVATFLAMLQDKGRLVDFLMDDINSYDDSQVGAAARVVHAGCKAVLQEHLRIVPLRQESEGSTIQIPRGYQADEYRLVGKIVGEAPFSGVLVHRGWKTLSVKLPRILGEPGGALPTLAPAEVELR
ncbi:MAG: DUF2760 domain-containing protein [Acetobacteraceae bacterium]|nr:DUF2760 domain-containing protein [Acetobacteraceae bacterium]